ncbi:hypothetical protein TSUD_332590 [Trifolium subterraneum]|uniref:Uncharacterized protein n=1 Tax=Trifolium subterraneum TaxID=3900 RepID=A0A2Z6MG21_TRISU|nr:hypothetical protein TSUD_332590 [Trifolium subterraneum]
MQTNLFDRTLCTTYISRELKAKSHFGNALDDWSYLKAKSHFGSCLIFKYIVGLPEECRQYWMRITIVMLDTLDKKKLYNKSRSECLISLTCIICKEIDKASVVVDNGATVFQMKKILHLEARTKRLKDEDNYCDAQCLG